MTKSKTRLAGRDSSKGPAKQGRPNIFISTSGSTSELACRIAELLRSWDCDAYCYVEDKNAGNATGPFISLLVDRLKDADAVVALISRDVRWSQYCQAELGATLFSGKPRVLVPIPPVEWSEAMEIAQVFQGHNTVPMKDGFSANEFGEALAKTLGVGGSIAKHTDRAKVDEHRIIEEINRLIERSAMEADGQLVRIWPSIDRNCRPAQEAIIRQIVASLENDKRSTTKLVLVGVSLKFSLGFVSSALDRVIDNRSRRHIGNDHTLKESKKELQINLIHMSAHSHILQALGADLDVALIRENFEFDWDQTVSEWLALCEKASIKFNPPKVTAIDYIPPLLGILVDDEAMFGGHCGFEEKVQGRFQLRVGEGEYFQYSSKDTRGAAAIQRFKDAVNAYVTPAHNAGVLLVGNTSEWDSHLCPAIQGQSKCRVTFISQTQSRFTKTRMLQDAISLGHEVEVFIGDSSANAHSIARNKIEVSSLEIRRASAAALPNCSGSIHYFKHEPDYRAVIVGDKLLGFEPYVHCKPAFESCALELEPSHVRFVVLGSSPLFQSIKRMLLQSIEAGDNESLSLEEFARQK